MNNKGKSKCRGSTTCSPKSNSSRPSSPPSPKQATKPSSPEEEQVTWPVSILSNREQGKYSGKSNVQPVHPNVNFLKKNRKAVQKFYKRTGVPSTPGEHSKETLAVQSRTKIGTPRLIGDELGTPSNKGSSFFLSSSHNGVREPHKRVNAKKQQISDS